MKIILFKGGVETLTFFSCQMAHYFEKKGHKIFWYDLNESELCAKKVRNFIKPNQTILLTFNFLGLSGEKGCYEENRGYIWEQYQIPCINILVDHPLYYTERYEQVPKRYFQVLIDRKHEAYMKEYFPEISVLGFMPLAGTVYERLQSHDVSVNDRDFYDFSSLYGENEIQWKKKRPIAVLFTGNYSDPKEYEKFMARINEEYYRFYKGIVSELLHHPERTLEEVAKRHCIREMGHLTKQEWQICFQHMNFLDLYIRFYERQEVVKTLVEAQIPVTVYGHGWEKLSCRHKECLHMKGPIDSKECLRQMTMAQISLNVMPWFKDGAHDRIYNSMLSGAVCVSDDSIYLRERFTKEQIIFYSLTDRQDIVLKVKELLAHPNKMYAMAKEGFLTCYGMDEWSNRAAWLSQFFEKILQDV